MSPKNKKPAKFSYKSDKKDRKIGKILGIWLSSTPEVELLAQVIQKLDQKKSFFVVTPNPEIIVMAQGDPVLSSVLNSAAFSLPDGVGLTLVHRLSVFGRQYSVDSKGSTDNSLQNTDYRLPKLERIPGVDFMEKLIGVACERGWRVFLLGGGPGVAEETALRLSRKFKFQNSKFKVDSSLRLNSHGEPINENERKKERKCLENIAAFKPQLLFVGFGAPKQEKWIARNLPGLHFPVMAMTVGGAFDYLSGQVPRAPKWVRELGFEWLFRLIVEPWRWRRQLALLKFIWMAVRYNSKFRV